MRRKFGLKRCTALLTAGCMAAAVLCGCSDGAVDYSLDTEGSSEESSGGLAQFAELSQWTDEWEITGADGKAVTFQVDAKITVPDTDAMSVAEVEETVIDGAFKEHLARAFFGEETVYYHDREHLSKEELQEQVEDLENRIQVKRDDIEGYQGLIEINKDFPEEVERYQEYIQEAQDDIQEYEAGVADYQNLMSTAPEQYMPADDFGECDEYVAYRNGQKYLFCVYTPESSSKSNQLDMRTYEETVKITLEPEDSIESWKPEELEGKSDWILYTSADVEGDVNQCETTKEEARELAERFVEQAGFSHRMCNYAEDIVWCGFDQNANGSRKNEEYVTKGYVFTFVAGIDGRIPLSGFSNYYYDGYQMSDEDYGMQDMISIIVNDDGIARVIIDNPVTVTSAAGNVGLLSFQTVQGIMQAEIQEHPDRYDLENLKPSNIMELNYLRVKDGSRDKVYSYIPAWELSYQGNTSETRYHPVYVNAIDGSVIYPWKEK
ncbi:MAG: hypothetical protein K2N01_09545 [Lachnospiraceae bacterium]|nr:hypothetical protein [Lachnospiraceae bacterium]